MSRITRKLLQNNLATLSKLLNRPEANVVNGKWVVGSLYLGEDGYGYSVEEVLEEGGCVRSLQTGMTARECYEFFQGAFAVCRLSGLDGSIEERWNGTSVRGCRASAVVRYHGATDTKGSRWKAKIENVYAYATYEDGPIVAAIKAAEKAGLNSARPRKVVGIGSGSDSYAIEF
jgi:hypothetical protein